MRHDLYLLPKELSAHVTADTGEYMHKDVRTVVFAEEARSLPFEDWAVLMREGPVGQLYLGTTAAIAFDTTTGTFVSPFRFLDVDEPDTTPAPFPSVQVRDRDEPLRERVDGWLGVKPHVDVCINNRCTHPCHNPLGLW